MVLVWGMMLPLDQAARPIMPRRNHEPLVNIAHSRKFHELGQLRRPAIPSGYTWIAARVNAVNKRHTADTMINK
jgi:hypothetical protein